MGRLLGVLMLGMMFEVGLCIIISENHHEFIKASHCICYSLCPHSFAFETLPSKASSTSFTASMAHP